VTTVGETTLSGITAEKAESIFNPVIPNPTKK
jgi:hypothetical protein